MNTLIETSWCNFDKNIHLTGEPYSFKRSEIWDQIDETIKNIPALKIIQNESLLNNTIEIANSFAKEKEKIIIFGIGGSNLGSRALVNILSNKKSKVFFYDNIDPINFEIFLKKFNLEKVGFVIISKSGSTLETLSQLSCLEEIFCQKNNLEIFYKNCLILTEDNTNPLRNFGIQNKCIILNHEKNIGGRYSVFSNVGMLPAIIAGLDVKEIHRGAQTMLEMSLNRNYVDHKYLAHFLRFQHSTNYTNSVLMTYSDSLYYFGKWYLQLWAESIGKDNKGITLIHSVGATDQHSQLQLYLDGPKDKFFTFVTTNHLNKGLLLNKKIIQTIGLEHLKDKKMGDLMQAEQQATINTFKKNGFIFRQINLPVIDEFLIGQLMCASILETVSACIYFEVNPFDQPAVEQGKIETKRLLKSL